MKTPKTDVPLSNGRKAFRRKTVNNSLLGESCESKVLQNLVLFCTTIILSIAPNHNLLFVYLSLREKETYTRDIYLELVTKRVHHSFYLPSPLA
jgi:hypothetical protein